MFPITVIFFRPGGPESKFNLAHITSGKIYISEPSLVEIRPVVFESISLNKHTHLHRVFRFQKLYLFLFKSKIIIKSNDDSMPKGTFMQQ